jgi:hypothetical protein
MNNGYGQPMQNGYGTQQPMNNSYGNAQQPYQSSINNGYNQQNYYPANTSTSMATASMVLGIISIVFGGGLWSILGVVFGILYMNKGTPIARGRAKTGVICSVIGFVIGIISTLIFFASL